MIAATMMPRSVHDPSPSLDAAESTRLRVALGTRGLSFAMSRIALAALLLLPVSLGAQWLDWRTPGNPRTADGKPNLAAPAPRTPDGTPDLVGRVGGPLPTRIASTSSRTCRTKRSSARPRRRVFQRRVVDFRRDDPVTNCLPGGPSDMLSATYRIMQSPDGRSRCCTRTAPGASGRSTWTDARCRRIRTRRGWAIRWGDGMATRWWSSPPASTIGPGSTELGILILKSCA